VNISRSVKPKGSRRQGPPASSESAALSQSQCIPRTNQASRASFVCVSVFAIQASRTAEPARVIRVISAQPVTKISRLDGSPFVCVCVSQSRVRVKGARESP